MATDNRPNLHAIGLLTDIIQAIETRKRGVATGQKLPKEVFELAAEFVEKVDAVINDYANRPRIGT